MNKTPRAAPLSAIPAFTPVPRRFARHDGWTVKRQRGFIAALASLGEGRDYACRAVGRF